MGKQYHYNGRVIGVEADGGRWIVASETHRVTSKFLPPCGTKEECQKYLDTWAQKKRLEEAKEETPQPGREVPPGGLVGGGQYLFRRRDKPGSPYCPVEYRGQADGYHSFYAAGSACVKPIRPLSEAALCHYEIRAYAS
jgi:hypothetical protein